MIRLIAAALVVAASARAGEPAAAGDAAAAPVTVPSTGVDDAPRRGTFVEAMVGVSTATAGGLFSNAEPYFGLAFGRDLGAAASLFASVGFTASNYLCNDAASQNACFPENSFGATFLELGGSYGFAVAPRFLLSAKALAGMTIFSPGSFSDSSAPSPSQQIAPHVGGGLSLEYQTRLDHFTVGLDTLLRYSRISRAAGEDKIGIAWLSVVPRLRYVF